MMTSNRKFEIWRSDEKRFAVASGDAFEMKTKLNEEYGISISQSTLYKMKPDQTKLLTPGHEVVKTFIKCIK